MAKNKVGGNNSAQNILKLKKTLKPKAKIAISQDKKKVTKNYEKTKVIIDRMVSEANVFEVNNENVEKALHGVLKLHSENLKQKNQLFKEDQFPIFMQIACHKIPKGFSKIYRVPLKHSLYDSESEICLVVSEVKGIKNSEHEQHKEHYENLLANKGITNIKNIMTFHEFRTEYETFEQKNRLADLYDVFLADSKISGKLVGKCGKIFYKKRKVPISVKLQVTQLKNHIENTLLKSFLHLHLKGNCFNIQVGNSKMTIKQLKENVQSVIDFLKKDFPGGMNNVMGIEILAPRTSSIPIYFSTKSSKDVETPKITVKKPKGFKTVSGELTTLPNAKVIVKPTGKVIVRKMVEHDDLAPSDEDTSGKRQIIGKNQEGKTLDKKKRKLQENDNDAQSSDGIDSSDNDSSPRKKTKLKKDMQTNNNFSNENVTKELHKGKVKLMKNKSQIHNDAQTFDVNDENISKKKNKVNKHMETNDFLNEIVTEQLQKEKQVKRGKKKNVVQSHSENVSKSNEKNPRENKVQGSETKGFSSKILRKKSQKGKSVTIELQQKDGGRKKAKHPNSTYEDITNTSSNESVTKESNGKEMEWKENNTNTPQSSHYKNKNKTITIPLESGLVLEEKITDTLSLGRQNKKTKLNKKNDVKYKLKKSKILNKKK